MKKYMVMMNDGETVLVEDVFATSPEAAAREALTKRMGFASMCRVMHGNAVVLTKVWNKGDGAWVTA